MKKLGIIFAGVATLGAGACTTAPPEPVKSVSHILNEDTCETSSRTTVTNHKKQVLHDDTEVTGLDAQCVQQKIDEANHNMNTAQYARAADIFIRSLDEAPPQSRAAVIEAIINASDDPIYSADPTSFMPMAESLGAAWKYASDNQKLRLKNKITQLLNSPNQSQADAMQTVVAKQSIDTQGWKQDCIRTGPNQLRCK